MVHLLAHPVHSKDIEIWPYANDSKSLLQPGDFDGFHDILH